MPLVIAEGLEDALSIAQAAAAREVIGLPGVGRFSKFDVATNTDVVVFRDGDVAESAAAKQLAEAVDRWVLAGARVRLTETPAGADANSILQDKGPDELRRLIAEATPAQLSFDAGVVRLAALEPVQIRAPAYPFRKAARSSSCWIPRRGREGSSCPSRGGRR